jgi:hypothetical protein
VCLFEKGAARDNGREQLKKPAFLLGRGVDPSGGAL